MNILKYMNENKVNNIGTDEFMSARADLFKKGIKLSWDKDNRVLFSAIKNHPYFQDPLYREANGTLLCYKNQQWHPLVIPTPVLRSNIANVNHVNKNLNKYKIYKAFDGTVVNLYFFNDTWRLSTSNGFDVTNLEWCGMTFQKAFDEVLDAHSIATNEFYNTLEPGKCYTIAFKHPLYHPFWGPQKEPKYDLRFIRSVDYSNYFSDGTLIISEDLPHESKWSMEKQTTDVNDITSLKDIFTKLPKTLDQYFQTGEVLYGYVLISTDEKTTLDHSHLYLESKLSASIRRLWYHKTLTKKAENYDRVNYIVTYSFLSSQLNPVFIKLFPQYIMMYNKLTEIAETLSKHIFNFIQNSQEPENMTDIEKIAYSIYKGLSNVLTLRDISEQESRVIINSFIVNQTYLDYFYNLLTDNH